MKLSKETFEILKNFATINSGLYFRKGNVLKTVSSQKNILAEVNISEVIPADFGVYDLNNFLSVVSLHKDDTSFEFDEKHVNILGNKGRSKIKYRFCDPTMIVVPPEKSINLPNAEIKFTLTSDDFDWIMRAANVLASPQISVISDGSKVHLVTMDTSNDSAHTEALEIADGNGDVYEIIFRTENLSRIMSGEYQVQIASGGISSWKNSSKSLQYWITTETGSTYQKA